MTPIVLAARADPAGAPRSPRRPFPDSRLDIFRGAGHYPFDEDARRFAKVLREFLAMTEPSSYDEDEIRRRLLAGAAA